jgi:hypothetical protein
MPPRVEALDAAALIARLQAHSADPEVQAQCCQALCDSSQLSEEAALSFLPAIVLTLRAHPAHAELQRNGCALLGLICRARSEDALASAAGADDGVRAVIAALRAHRDDADLQCSCCAALNAVTVAGLRETAVDAGAVQAVVAALRVHVLYARVDLICDALGQITVRQPLAVAQAGAAGAVAAVVAALRAHLVSAQVQASGCFALGSLAFADEMQTEAIHAGAIEAILLALRTHAADVDVQTYGSMALGNIATKGGAAIEERSSDLVREALVAALRAHAADVLVQTTACSALDCLVNAHPRLQAAAGAAGAVEAVVDVMRMPAADARPPLYSIAALNVLVGHRGNAARACAAGVMDALAVAMTASYAHGGTDTQYGVYDAAVRTLHALLESNDDAACFALHAGVLDVLVREGTQRSHSTVLGTHAGVLSLLEAAAQRHDAAVCEQDGCKRCAAARATGRMCALPGCDARRRDGDGAKKLLRCGSCRAACYCAPAHTHMSHVGCEPCVGEVSTRCRRGVGEGGSNLCRSGDVNHSPRLCTL